MLVTTIFSFAQEAKPTVTFFHKEENEEVTLNESEEKITEAPLDITCNANIDCPADFTYKVEWRLFKENDGEEKPIITRYDEDMTYTLTSDGAYCVKLYVTFTGKDNQQTIDKAYEKIKIVISSSKLSCPDGFSPNGDDINDELTIDCQSIVKMSGGIFNRWGQCLKTINLETIRPAKKDPRRYCVWDGLQGGKPVKDGVYFINIDAYGSDGIHYKIKKAINVLTGYRETTDNPSM